MTKAGHSLEIQCTLRTQSKMPTTVPSTLLKTLLLQCLVISRLVLENFYQRIQRRRGGGKANITLVRKFLGVISHPQEQLGVRELPQLRSGLLKTGQTNQ